MVWICVQSLGWHTGAIDRSDLLETTLQTQEAYEVAHGGNPKVVTSRGLAEMLQLWVPPELKSAVPADRDPPYTRFKSPCHFRMKDAILFLERTHFPPYL